MNILTITKSNIIFRSDINPERKCKICPENFRTLLFKLRRKCVSCGCQKKTHLLEKCFNKAILENITLKGLGSFMDRTYM